MSGLDLDPATHLETDIANYVRTAGNVSGPPGDFSICAMSEAEWVTARSTYAGIAGTVGSNGDRVFSLTREAGNQLGLFIYTSSGNFHNVLTSTVVWPRGLAVGCFTYQRLTSGTSKARVGTLAGRISTCGPPRAVLLTVEPSEFGRR